MFRQDTVLSVLEIGNWLIGKSVIITQGTKLPMAHGARKANT